MKRLSLQWRITLMSVLLIGITCVAMNLLLCSSGVYYMDTIADSLQGGTMILNDGGAASFDPQLIAPNEELTIVVDGVQGRFRTTNWYITAAVTLLSGILAYFVSGRALKPLRSFASQVEQVQLNNLADMRIDEDAISEFRQLSRSFNQMLERLNNAFSAQRQFTGNAAHELRTPLTVIAGFLDLADMDVPPELRKRHLALMRDQTARMKRLTDDLLMLSKLENRDERGTDQPELIDMSALIDDAVREGMAYSKMQHKFEVAHEPLSLLGHPEEIRSAVLNLITNAVRYTPRGGRIRVVWKRTGTGAVLTVADTGIGISPEHLPRITERFYRVDKGRSRDTGGTGLGLAIVKHVMRRAGGELSIESTPGEGSKFMLRFPEERIFSGRYL